MFFHAFFAYKIGSSASHTQHSPMYSFYGSCCCQLLLYTFTLYKYSSPRGKQKSINNHKTWGFPFRWTFILWKRKHCQRQAMFVILPALSSKAVLVAMRIFKRTPHKEFHFAGSISIFRQAQVFTIIHATHSIVRHWCQWSSVFHFFGIVSLSRNFWVTHNKNNYVTVRSPTSDGGDDNDDSCSVAVEIWIRRSN